MRIIISDGMGLGNIFVSIVTTFIAINSLYEKKKFKRKDKTRGSTMFDNSPNI